jgi:hypothetical protein
VPCKEEGRIKKLHSEAALVGKKTRNATRMKMIKSKCEAVGGATEKAGRRAEL